MSLEELGDPKYISLETYRRNGTAVATPVWAVLKNSKRYVWTQADSWKVKRIRSNPKVRVCKCNSRGDVEGAWFEAQARILDDPADEVKMRGWLAEKYGLFYRLFSLAANLIRRGKRSVVIEISG